MALSGRKRGRPAKKAGRMRDAQASSSGPKTADSIFEKEKQKKAGSKRKGEGGTTVMPSIFETLSIRGHERQTYRDAVSIKSMDEAKAFIDTFEKDEKAETELWTTTGRARAMQHGAVWAAATAEGGFVQRAVQDGRTTEAEAAKDLFDRHVQTVRLWARVFKRRDDVPEAVSLYEMYKDQIPFATRKTNGIDYDRDCLRLLDAARKAAGKDAKKQQLEPTEEDVVKAGTDLVPVAGTRPTAPVTADQKYLRMISILTYCLAVMRQKNIATPFTDFDNAQQVEKAINGLQWDKESDLALWEEVKGQAFATMNVGVADDAAEPFAGRLIDYSKVVDVEAEEVEEPKKKAANGRRKSGNGRKKAGNGRRKKQAAPVTPETPETPEGEGQPE